MSQFNDVNSHLPTEVDWGSMLSLHTVHFIVFYIPYYVEITLIERKSLVCSSNSSHGASYWSNV